MHRSLVCLILATALLSPHALRAQSELDADTLPPVVVTSSRQGTSILQAPYAASIVDSAKLQQTRGYGLDEVLAGVPSVLAQSRAGNQDVRISIRGYGARGAGERSNAGTSRGIRMLIDGIPITEPDGRTAFDLVDFSTAGGLELIRSNASSPWGNAAGGVLNLVSTPAFNSPFVMTESSHGSYGYRKELITVGAIPGPGRLYLTFGNTNFDGWRDHSRSSRALAQGNLIAPVGDKSILNVHLSATSNVFEIPGPLTPSQYADDPSQAQDDTMNYRPTYTQRDERRFNRLGLVGLTFDHQFDQKQRLSVSAFVSPKYLQRSERNTFRDFTRYHVGGSATYRRMYDVSSRTKGSLLVGVDEGYQDGAILFYNLVDGERGSDLVSNQREGANSIGGFIENQLLWHDRWALILGARADDVTYYYEDRMEPSLNDSRSFTHLTPKVTASCRFSTNHSIYASLGGGVEVPAGNETDPPSVGGLDTVSGLNPLLDPIRSITVEIGSKQRQIFESDHWVRQLSYDIAGYWITIADDIIPYRGGRFYLTAGKTRKIGLETAATIEFKRGLRIDMSLTQSQDQYVEYLVDSTHYGRPGAIADYADNDLAGVPSTYYRFAIHYSSRKLLGAFVESAAQGVGQYFVDDANSIDVPEYCVVNAKAGLRGLKLGESRFSIDAFLGINNLLDRTYVSSAFVNPDRGSISREAIYLEPGLPRNWSASISVTSTL